MLWCDTRVPMYRFSIALLTSQCDVGSNYHPLLLFARVRRHGSREISGRWPSIPSIEEESISIAAVGTNPAKKKLLRFWYWGCDPISPLISLRTIFLFDRMS